MRQIFLDLGAWDGASVKFFRKHYPNGNAFEVICFEPLPENIIKLREIPNIQIYEAACDIKNGKAKFYTGLSESGSLSKEKRSGNLNGETAITVKTIDFPHWFNELVSGDYVPQIIIKMNIEGAEYDIISRMHHYGLIPFVHKWFIQWHYDKVGIPLSRHERVKRLIPEAHPWKAMFKDWENSESWQQSILL